MATTMRALIQTNDGYSRTPSESRLEAMEPYVEPAEVAVPEPGASQVLIKVRLASINPSDVMFVKGLYGQPRRKGQPAGFEGVAKWSPPAATPDPGLSESAWRSRSVFPAGVRGRNMPWPRRPRASRSSTACATKTRRR